MQGFFIVQVRLAVGVHDMCRWEINRPEPEATRFIAIDELVVDLM